MTSVDRPLPRPSATTIARTLLAVFALTQVVLTLGSGPTPVAFTVLALLLTVAAATIAVLAQDRAAPWSTVAVVALTAAGSAATVPWLPRHGWSGDAGWPLAASTFVAVALALRGRIAAAWLTMTLLAVLCAVWGAASGAGVPTGIALIERPIGILVIGTLCGVGLRRAARTTEQLQAVQRWETLERGVAQSELQVRGDAARRVLVDAGPTLERIAAGDRFAPAERGRILALEGRLRDEITLAPLLSDALREAIAAARTRGIDAIVLTDPAVAALPASVRRPAAGWIAERAERSRGTEFVARVVLHGDDVRVSATTDGGEEEVLLLSRTS